MPWEQNCSIFSSHKFWCCVWWREWLADKCIWYVRWTLYNSVKIKLSCTFTRLLCNLIQSVVSCALGYAGHLVELWCQMLQIGFRSWCFNVKGGWLWPLQMNIWLTWNVNLFTV